MGSPLEQRFITGAQEARTASNGLDSPVETIRARGMDAFSRVGFPLPREEAWKYTPVRKWLSEEFEFRGSDVASEAASEALDSWISQDCYIISSVNGRLVGSIAPELPDGVELLDLRQDVSGIDKEVAERLSRFNDGAEDVFASLNQSFLSDGLVIRIKEGVSVDRPIVLTDALTRVNSAFLNPRIAIIAEKNSDSVIVDLRTNAAPGLSFENLVVQVTVGDSARLQLLHLFDRGPSSRMVRHLSAYQTDSSHFSSIDFTLSGDLVRHNLNYLPDGENCQTDLNGFYLASGKSHIDIHTFVDHAKPQCLSNELFKGILSDQATGVFNGRVLVRQDAQQINAYQSNRNVVMNEGAHIYSKPELEIYADDVKCSHGATTGQLDEEALFYLRSRGIREINARSLLLEAFAAELIESIEVEFLKDEIYKRVRENLQAIASGLNSA